MTQVKKEALQRWLYSRILEHLHDPDLEKLAVPGLVLRRLTSGVIRTVLAVPCGLGEMDEARAQALLDGLAQEITLVEKDSADSVRHRQGVRQLMLEAMPQEDAVVREIDSFAVRYWEAQTGAEARAEEIYHRLPEARAHGRHSIVVGTLERAPSSGARSMSSQQAPSSGSG